MMRYLLSVIVMAVTACSPPQTTPRPDVSPLRFNAAAVAAADEVVVMIPGALARVDIFEPAEAWESPSRALVWYRFPGLDGLAPEPALVIEQAASEIAELMAQHPDKAWRLLGYSTGGPIAISAAEQFSGDVRVAAMSSAVERAGGLATMVRTSADLLAAAARVGSTDRNTVWLEYYKTLLFGRRVRGDAALDARASRITDARLDEMIYPEPALLAAHSDNLRKWRLANRPRLAADRLRFFIGGEDPVFSAAQTERFAAEFGAPEIVRYPGQGHLLFLTAPGAFDDILAFFSDAPG
ncbi:alpha/beta hydrolase [uncultured Roseobacter sp.]|uniref:alpha/beta fold hydrolase n=1 Tax=uncultured Roseobacter sp. TaxID=114847 RepID=UPI0026047533|nr:alpha/beta hydrolase [uncultured Roseobacter sp.]